VLSYEYSTTIVTVHGYSSSRAAAQFLYCSSLEDTVHALFLSDDPSVATIAVWLSKVPSLVSFPARLTSLIISPYNEKFIPVTSYLMHLYW
jgi:hypothetical protein